jgi:hypothetical protein
MTSCNRPASSPSNSDWGNCCHRRPSSIAEWHRAIPSAICPLKVVMGSRIPPAPNRRGECRLFGCRHAREQQSERMGGRVAVYCEVRAEGGQVTQTAPDQLADLDGVDRHHGVVTSGVGGMLAPGDHFAMPS